MIFAYYLHDEKSSEQFEKTLLWFRDRYNLISIRELREHIYEGKKLHNSCMLSVDDGWRSTYNIIYPVMRKYNVPFTIFVSPHVMETGMNFWYYTMKFCNEDKLKDIMIKRKYFSADVRKYPCDLIFKEILIDDVYDVLNEYLSKHQEVEIPRGFMNTQEVIELHKSGLVEIGAHTMTHPILNAEEDSRSYREITDSVSSLSSLLNYEVRSFAYPNGIKGVDYSNRDMMYAQKAGIDMAFSVNPGIITNHTNPLSIPRWGSTSRLKFGPLGQFLPSRANQGSLRAEIRKLKL